MQKEIVIGGDLKPNFNSVCLWHMADISENSKFYILDTKYSRIYVVKESEEGEGIKEWLINKENRNNEAVKKKAIELILPRLTSDDFFEIINGEIDCAWKEGYRMAQFDIRKALGMAR